MTASHTLNGRPRERRGPSIPETPAMNRKAAAYWIPTGAYHRARRGRDPVVGMTTDCKEGETRWQGMTACCGADCAKARLENYVAGGFSRWRGDSVKISTPLAVTPT